MLSSFSRSLVSLDLSFVDQLTVADYVLCAGVGFNFLVTIVASRFLRYAKR